MFLPRKSCRSCIQENGICISHRQMDQGKQLKIALKEIDVVKEEVARLRRCVANQGIVEVQLPPCSQAVKEEKDYFRSFFPDLTDPGKERKEAYDNAIKEQFLYRRYEGYSWGPGYYTHEQLKWHRSEFVSLFYHHSQPQYAFCWDELPGIRKAGKDLEDAILAWEVLCQKRCQENSDYLAWYVKASKVAEEQYLNMLDFFNVTWKAKYDY